MQESFEAKAYPKKLFDGHLPNHHQRSGGWRHPSKRGRCPCLVQPVIAEQRPTHRPTFASPTGPGANPKVPPSPQAFPSPRSHSVAESLAYESCLLLCHHRIETRSSVLLMLLTKLTFLPRDHFLCAAEFEQHFSGEDLNGRILGTFHLRLDAIALRNVLDLKAYFRSQYSVDCGFIRSATVPGCSLTVACASEDPREMHAIYQCRIAFLRGYGLTDKIVV
jgi:hypothetical protein